MPVTWDAEGWPHIFGGKTAIEQVSYEDTKLASYPLDSIPVRDTFNAPFLGFHWNAVRSFPTFYALHPPRGGLFLYGKPGTLSDSSCAFIVQRQRHFDCLIETRVSFSTSHENEEAGIALRQCYDAYYAWVLTLRNHQPAVVFKRKVGNILTESRAYPVSQPDQITLVVQANRSTYTFGICQENHIQ